MVDGGLEKAQVSGPRAFKRHGFLNARVLRGRNSIGFDIIPALPLT
jgi:hypothetical protein